MKNRRLRVSIASLVAVSLALHPVRSQTADAAAPSASVSQDSSFTGAASTSSPSPGVTVSTNKAAPPHTVAYTVVAGDTLTKLATRYNTTRKKLKALNDLASSKITPGQVIYVPASATKKSSTASSTAKAKHHTYLAAQPVQDFDIPASNFASCPVPASNSSDDESVATPAGEKAAPIAQLVSPSELAADEAKRQREANAEADAAATSTSTDAAPERLTATLAPARLALPTEPTAQLKPKSKHKTASSVTASTGTLTASTNAPAPQQLAPEPAPSGWANNSAHHFAQTPMNPPPAPRPSGSHFWNIFSSHSDSDLSMNTPAFDPSNEWGYRFLKASRALGDRGIDYDDDWRPPGERSSWVMDCSNTSRWLYKSVAGINLPRTASDQYYYLHLQGKAWDVPNGSTGWADVDYLQRHLKPGDLLFWENTYRPERQPPITHVMVFLGTNERGQWIMAGSQSSRGGEHNRRDGGPDVYVFRPSQPCGGYTSWFVHHQGRFCAYGRPLEADPSKFAVND